jgi:hypothetical protein
MLAVWISMYAALRRLRLSAGTGRYAGPCQRTVLTSVIFMGSLHVSPARDAGVIVGLVRTSHPIGRTPLGRSRAFGRLAHRRPTSS